MQRAHRLLGLAGLAALATLVAACAEPLQNGGVEMHGGAEARLGALCRFHRGSEKDGFCAPVEEVAPPARVRRIASEADRPRGARAEGQVGDYVLDNGEIVVVIGAPRDGSAGAVVDAADARTGEDELGRVEVFVGAGASPVLGEVARAGVDHGGVAWVEVKGRAQSDARLAVITRYELQPGARALVMSTLVAARGSEPVPLPAFGDAVVWGAAEEALPGKEKGAHGAFQGPIVAAVGTAAAYAIVPADDRPALEGESSPERTLVRAAHDVTLEPGGAVQYDRVLVVAPRGDTLGLLTELAFLRENRAPGAVDVRFVDAQGRPASPPPGGRVLLSSAQSPLAPYVRISAAAQGADVAAEAPPGRYRASLDAPGLRAAAEVSVEVRSGEVTALTLQLAPTPAPAPEAPAPSPAESTP
jgi:hypothetical protein